MSAFSLREMSQTMALPMSQIVATRQSTAPDSYFLISMFDSCTMREYGFGDCLAPPEQSCALTAKVLSRRGIDFLAVLLIPVDVAQFVVRPDAPSPKKATSPSILGRIPALE